jgi:membrane complex biogenesis BtpA family protein
VVMKSKLFSIEKPIVGMVHLPPLPGAPTYSGQPLSSIIKFALSEAKALEDGGIDAILVENFNDYPYLVNNVPKSTIIAMAAVLYEIKESVNVPIGVNVLFNDVEAEIYLASCLGLDFIRVEGFVDLLISDMGPIMPSAPVLLRLKHILKAEKVAILADVQGKYTSVLPPKSIEESARDALERGGADAVIVTGARTGEAVPKGLVHTVKSRVPEARVFLGSGVTPENIVEVFEICDGAIVGSYFKKDGNVKNPVDAVRVRKLMEVVHKMRDK